MCVNAPSASVYVCAPVLTDAGFRVILNCRPSQPNGLVHVRRRFFSLAAVLKANLSTETFSARHCARQQLCSVVYMSARKKAKEMFSGLLLDFLYSSESFARCFLCLCFLR